MFLFRYQWLTSHLAAGYLDGVRALCDKYEILWIADEVMCGFGRTGKWFGYQHSKSTPDLIVFAKGVTSGYLPLGGVVISEPVTKTFDERVFPGGLTYSGHPLACATAVATIDVMKDSTDPRFLANKSLRNYLIPPIASKELRKIVVSFGAAIDQIPVTRAVVIKTTNTHPGTSPLLLP